jgi:predicted small secreted protein
LTVGAAQPKSGAIDLRESSSMRKLIVLAAAAMTVLVAGCNTIQGMGRDMQAAGQAVSSSAQDAKH